MASEPLEMDHLDRGVLSFRGPLTMENVTPFLNAVRRESAPTMILDLSGVPYLDSSGLGSLVSACTSAAKAGRRIALAGVNHAGFEGIRDYKGGTDIPDVSDAFGRDRGTDQRGQRLASAVLANNCVQLTITRRGLSSTSLQARN